MNDLSAVRDRCIAYAFLPFLTPARTRLLLETFESLDVLISVPPKVLQGLLGIDSDQAVLVKDPLRNATVAVQIDSLRGRSTTFVDDDYPPLLKEIADPPLALFYRGELACDMRGGVARIR